MLCIGCFLLRFERLLLGFFLPECFSGSCGLLFCFLDVLDGFKLFFNRFLYFLWRVGCIKISDMETRRLLSRAIRPPNQIIPSLLTWLRLC